MGFALPNSSSAATIHGLRRMQIANQIKQDDEESETKQQSAPALQEQFICRQVDRWQRQQWLHPWPQGASSREEA
jgi:hypothetical protein